MNQQQTTEPINAIIPTKNQLVPANPLVTIVRAPIDIWRCGPIGWFVGVGLVVVIIANLLAFDLVRVPHVLQPANFSSESEEVTLARIESHTTIEVEKAKSAAMSWKHIGIRYGGDRCRCHGHIRRCVTEAGRNARV